MYPGEDPARTPADPRDAARLQVLNDPAGPLSGRRLALVAGLLVAIWLAMLWGGQGPADRSLYRVLYVGDAPAVAELAHVLTFFGEPWVAVITAAVAAAGLAVIGRGRDAVILLVINLVGRGLSVLQKVAIERPRPEVEPHLSMVTTSSFPSGHTTASMILFLSLALVLSRGTRWQGAAVAIGVTFAAAVGLSRVMLGVHWPSDVIAGWAYSILWVIIALAVAERFKR